MTPAKSVLVVEDVADDAFLLQLAVRKAPSPLALHFAPDGETAVAYLKGEGQYANREAFPLPQLVLLDLRLPRMNGFQVLAWIRANPEFRALKVFVWAGQNSPENLRRAEQAGADRFVQKSKNAKAMINLICSAWQETSILPNGAEN